MKDRDSSASPMEEAMKEAQRLRGLARRCHEAAVRTLARGEAEPDAGRATRLFTATGLLLAAGRALRAAGG